MKTTHTPRPWTYADDGFVRDLDGHLIADPHMDDRDPEEREANGHLIAAAPDLLAACDRLARAAANRDNTMGDPLRLIEVQAELREATTAARTAIAKAEA